MPARASGQYVHQVAVKTSPTTDICDRVVLDSSLTLDFVIVESVIILHPRNNPNANNIFFIIVYLLIALL